MAVPLRYEYFIHCSQKYGMHYKKLCELIYENHELADTHVYDTASIKDMYLRYHNYFAYMPVLWNLNKAMGTQEEVWHRVCDQWAISCFLSKFIMCQDKAHRIAQWNIALSPLVGQVELVWGRWVWQMKVPWHVERIQKCTFWEFWIFRWGNSFWDVWDLALYAHISQDTYKVSADIKTRVDRFMLIWRRKMHYWQCFVRMMAWLCSSALLKQYAEILSICVRKSVNYEVALSTACSDSMESAIESLRVVGWSENIPNRSFTVEYWERYRLMVCKENILLQKTYDILCRITSAKALYTCEPKEVRDCFILHSTHVQKILEDWIVAYAIYAMREWVIISMEDVDFVRNLKKRITSEGFFLQNFCQKSHSVETLIKDWQVLGEHGMWILAYQLHEVSEINSTAGQDDAIEDWSKLLIKYQWLYPKHMEIPTLEKI